LKQAFSYALVGKLENELLAKIDQHTFTVYIISKVINLDSIREIIDVGVGILKAGGIAIKIETVGVAYTKEEWGNLAENKDSFPLYSHFVTLVRDENLIYSCGMQSFGLSDVVVSSKIDPAVATDLINSFNLYILLENPEIKDGNTFSIDNESPMYMVSHVTDFRYEEDDDFYNPRGLFELQQLSGFKRLLKKFKMH
jgi:hypothetical protein